MKKSELKSIIREILKEIIMTERPKEHKFSSFANDYKVDDGPDKDKLVVGKNNKDVGINEKGIKYLLTSLNSIMNTGTKAVKGEIGMSDYDPKKKTIKYNRTIIPIELVYQLERVGKHNFGEY